MIVLRTWGTGVAGDAGWGSGKVAWEYCAEEDFLMVGFVLVVGAMAPVTMSQSQSAMPPGVASMAVCGE